MSKKHKEKGPKDPVYTLRLSDIERIKRDATKEGACIAWKLMFGLPMMALRDQFGFGPARLERFMDATLSKHESYEKGYITLKDVDQMLEEECGIRIERSDYETANGKRLF